jgi:hypothetical protein
MFFKNTFKLIFVFLTFFVLSISFFGSTVDVSAQLNPTPTPTQTGASGSKNANSLAYLNLTNFDCIFDQQTDCEMAIYPKIVQFLKDISLPIATLFIIFGGFEWINDKDIKRTSASTTIFSAIGGYIVINISDTIVNIVKGTFTKTGFETGPIIEFMDQLINFGLNISTVVAVACLVLAGYSYYVEYFWNEGRQSDKLQPMNLMYGAVSGLVIITLARPIIAFVKSTFQVDQASAKVQFQNQPIIELIQNFLVRFAIPLAGILAVVFLVIAGYYYMSAQEDAKKIEAAKGMVTNAVIGFVVILLCTTMVQLITYFIKPVQGFIPVSETAPADPTTKPAVPQ